MASTALFRQTTSAKAEIYAIARDHGIAHQRSALDELGDAITRLAGDEIDLDSTEWLLVALDRAGVITGPDAVILHARYRRERQA